MKPLVSTNNIEDWPKISQVILWTLWYTVVWVCPLECFSRIELSADTQEGGFLDVKGLT